MKMDTTQGTTQSTTSAVSLADSFHPHIVTTIHADGETSLFTSVLASSSPVTKAWHCALDIRYQLPASVFVDRYQLNDTLLATPFIVHGSNDLEAPLEHAGHQDTWMIVRGDQSLWTPSSTPTTDMVVDIPLHLRYQAPDDTLTHRPISIPWPQVGWFCRNADQDDNNEIVSPPSLHASLHHFSSNNAIHLNLDDIQDTTPFVWIPVPPSSLQQQQQQQQQQAAIDVTTTPPPPPPPSLILKVPVGNTNDTWIVQWGTIIVILFGTCWILNAIAVAVQKHRRHEAKGKRRKSE